MAASSSSPSVSLVRLTPDRYDDAARVLAAAFAANPLHVAMFGRDVLARNHRFFLDRLTASDSSTRTDGADGPWLAALQDDRVVGVIHWHDEDDTDPPRSTLGPLGVHPDVQRTGVGSRLMQAYCDALDAARRAGFLETDQLDNLAFYERFEFAATGEWRTGGVVQYVMWRPALL